VAKEKTFQQLFQKCFNLEKPKYLWPGNLKP
jgi:hypothetical protein